MTGDMMGGGTVWAMGLVWLLGMTVLPLAAAAPIKHLNTRKSRRDDN